MEASERQTFFALLVLMQDWERMFPTSPILYTSFYINFVQNSLVSLIFFPHGSHKNHLQNQIFWFSTFLYWNLYCTHVSYICLTSITSAGWRCYGEVFGFLRVIASNRVKCVSPWLEHTGMVLLPAAPRTPPKKESNDCVALCKPLEQPNYSCKCTLLVEARPGAVQGNVR